jgi:hypothetical protein
MQLLQISCNLQQQSCLPARYVDMNTAGGSRDLFSIAYMHNNDYQRSGLTMHPYRSCLYQIQQAASR